MSSGYLGCAPTQYGTCLTRKPAALRANCRLGSATFEGGAALTPGTQPVPRSFSVLASPSERMAEAGSFVTVSKTAAPFVPQTTSTPDDDEDQEEDLVDTVATATAAAATVAFDTASRIQEAMESGSIWCV